jgi:hypothetical protein
MNGYGGIDTRSALKLANAEHHARIERAETHRIVSGLRVRRTSSARPTGLRTGLARTLRPVFTALAPAVLMGVAVIGAVSIG